MAVDLLSEKAGPYLRKLCREIPSRCVGSAGNRLATDFVAAALASFGFALECPEFDCMDWEQQGVGLSSAGHSFLAFASPYSPGCRVAAPLAVASTVAELEAARITDFIVLLRGDLTKEQLMPKNFTFYNPDEHRHIIELLETKKPKAVIAATSRDVEMVGAGVYPFPLFEDGDFNIPSIFMTEEEGNELAGDAGKRVALEVRAQRIPSRGCNVIARKGANLHRRVVLFAHIDAKMGSPGAIDNASGVIVMLLLAEFLADYSGALGVEIVALNGEDYYSSPGEQQYLALNAGRFDEIVLGINVDGAGYFKGKTAYSMYDCTSDVSGSIRQVISLHPGFVEGPAWYQGDHGLFLMNGRPALAITSELLDELMEITHTSRDSPEIIDCARLATVARALRDLLVHLDRQLPD